MAQGLTLEQLKSMGAKPAGLTLAQIQEQQKTAQPTTQPNLVSKIWSGLAAVAKTSGEQTLAGGQKIQESVSSGITGTRQNLEQGNLAGAFGSAGKMALGSASGLIQSIFAPVTATIQKTGEATDIHPLKELGKLPTMDGKSTIGEELKRTIQEHPEASETILDAVNVVGALYGARFADPILNANLKGLPSAYKGALIDIAKQPSKLVDDLTAKSEAQINSTIVKKFEKGVKPLLPGKTTPTKMSAYRNDVVEAVNTIKNNRDNLKYVDDGADQLIEPIVGQTPENLQQFTAAIEQTKKTIFDQYDELAKTAGKGGVKVEGAPIAKELDAVINNEALAFSHPETIQYAKNIQARLTQKVNKLTGKTTYKNFDAGVAQDIIQNYNKSLEAFYRNPSYDTASRAAIDALIANRMRQALDDGITGLTGVEYQALKNQYGSLKAIERDVTKAALRDARKNIKGLIDYTDIFSGGQVVNGILSLNPAQIASGLTQKAIAEFYKFINNPNRAIKTMFEVADETPGTSVIKGAVKEEF